MIKKIINDNRYEINIKENFIHLKNYKNIIDIYPNRISILLNNCKFVINGSNLIITGLDEYEIVIKGNIKGIDFNG